MKEINKIEIIIDKHIITIKKTRKNRITFSERLKKYSQRWKVAIFVYNLIAIFMIVWSLSNPNDKISIISPFFAIYVILLQYFINELNYSERSMKTHYHQLELRDFILELEMLELGEDDSSFNKNKIREIMGNYQTSLKNNENHSRKDHLKNIYEKESVIAYDFSLDNMFLWGNILICSVMLILIFI